MGGLEKRCEMHKIRGEVPVWFGNKCKSNMGLGLKSLPMSMYLVLTRVEA